MSLDRFIGRGPELAALHAHALRGDRLVTLLGPPGIGKTRLARRFMEEADAESWFCDASTARGVDDLAATVARALGVRRAEDVAGAISDAGPILLVLDNLEAIARVAAPVLADWCHKAPEALVLVTSRERLGLPGEHVVLVPPLDVETDALALWMERTRTESSAAVIALVRALEGIPLAIELAAARSRVLGPAKLLERLGSVASLATAIATSWELLDDNERSALAQCAVFTGVFSVEAAESVLECENVLDTLVSLHDKSLLRTDGDGHFSMYAAIREYAAAQPADRAGLARRHKRYFTRAAAAAYERFMRTGDSAARAELAVLKDELLAIGDDPDAILYLEPTLATESKCEDLIASLDRGLALAGDDALRGRLTLARGNARGVHGHLEASFTDCTAALALARKAGDRALEAEALMFLGVRHRNLGRFAEARAAGEEALAVLGNLDQPRVEGAVRAVMGLLLFELGDHAESRRSNMRARAIFDAAGDRWSEALPIANLAQLDQAEGEYEKSARGYDAALSRFREHGDRRYEARYLGYRAGLEHERGVASAARALYTTALELLAALRIAPTEGLFRACLAALEAAEGRSDDALRELDRAEMLLTDAASPTAVAALAVHRGHIDVVLGKRERAEERLRQAQLADRSEDVRFAVRLLTRALGPSGASAPARTARLVVEAGASSFQLGDQAPVDLGRRPALRSLLVALVHAQGRPLAWDELLAAGWPGQRVVGDAGQNRVRVAISTLRRLGLATVLQTSEQGYSLDPRALEVP